MFRISNDLSVHKYNAMITQATWYFFSADDALELKAEKRNINQLNQRRVAKLESEKSEKYAFSYRSLIRYTHIHICIYRSFHHV